MRALHPGAIPRYAVLAALLSVAAVAWLHLVWVSRDMYGAMDGASAWMMSADWGPSYLLLMVVMWVVMMTAMMLPSALPAILLYQRALQGGGAVDAAVRVSLFAAGYLLVWCGFAVAATLLQWGLASAAWLSPMMVSRSSLLGAGLLILAGVYQLTPLKRRCLDHCRSPAAFFMQHWRPGAFGALRLGARHGAYCVGCCWALMLLLFVGGVMSLLWIAALSVFVLLEKLAPQGVQGGRLSGLALVLAGVAVLLLDASRGSAG